MSKANVALFSILHILFAYGVAIAAQPSPSGKQATSHAVSESSVERVELPDDWYEELSRPKDGYVPNAETAISIAKAVWLPIYGPSVLRQLPVTAVLKDDEWHVSGTFQGKGFGGNATARIARMSGCVLEVSHGE